MSTQDCGTIQPSDDGGNRDTGIDRRLIGVAGAGALGLVAAVASRDRRR